MVQGCVTVIMTHAAVYAITRSRSHPRHKGPASMRPFSCPHGPQHVTRSAVCFSNDWPSFKRHIPCLFGSSGDRPYGSGQVKLSQDRTGKVWSIQVISCQVISSQVMSGQVKPGRMHGPTRYRILNGLRRAWLLPVTVGLWSVTRRTAGRRQRMAS